MFGTVGVSFVSYSTIVILLTCIVMRIRVVMLFIANERFKKWRLRHDMHCSIADVSIFHCTVYLEIGGWALRETIRYTTFLAIYCATKNNIITTKLLSPPDVLAQSVELGSRLS